MNVLKGICAVLVAVAGIVNIVAYNGDPPEPKDDNPPYMSGQEPNATTEPNGEPATTPDAPTPSPGESAAPDPTEPPVSPEPSEPPTSPEPSEPPPPAEAWLTDMIILLRSRINSNEYIIIEENVVNPDSMWGDETTFRRRIRISGGQSGIHYLQGKYSRLEATWESGGLATLEIFADDVMVYTHTSSGNETVPISLDITNCVRLRILVSGGGLSIWDPKLTPNAEFVPPESVFNITGVTQWLVDVAPHRSGPNVSKSPGISNTGESFSNRIQGRNNSADWRLDGQYTRLRGVFTLTDSHDHTVGSSDHATTLRILSNDVEIYAAELRRGELPIPIDLDITGCDKLTISFEGGALFANAALFE
jgi:hypothetical protein